MRIERTAQSSGDKKPSGFWSQFRSARLTTNIIGLSFVALTVVAVSLWVSPGLGGVLGAALGIVALSVAAIDVRHYVIPDALNFFALILGLIYVAVTNSDQVMSELALALVRGGVLAFGFFALRIGYFYVRGRVGIGLGDVKLAAVAGVWIDWPLMGPAVEIAAVSGLCAYLIRQYVMGRPIAAGSRLPFGAFLAPTIWLCWMLEQTILGRSG
jgi:leader peptidase (prepilin peptidase)/N-methyltransferase